MILLAQTRSLSYNELVGFGAEVDIYVYNPGAPITAAACFAYGDGTHWPGLTVGSGADPSPRAAIRKAILEHAFS